MLDPNVKAIEETVSTVATSLLNRAKQNDQESWNRLVEFHAPLVYRWCRSKGLSADDALDVGQEVFKAVAKNLDHFDRDQDHHSFRGWLRRITENKIRDHWRHKQREPTMVEECDSLVYAADEIDEATVGSDVNTVLVQILQYAKDRISPQHWDVFWDLVVEEQAAADVAEKYGLQRHNVYMIKSRVLRLLREISLEKDGGQSK